jgi:acyl CoA:acetate/3-ketoacid CoA transferase
MGENTVAAPDAADAIADGAALAAHNSGGTVIAQVREGAV